MTLIASADDVLSRTAALQAAFSTLTGSRGIEVYLKPTQTQVLIGVGPDAVASRPRDGRFPTRNRRVYLNYFEVWNSLKGGAELILDKAYLHLDVPGPEGIEETEILALHCDPCTPASVDYYNYRRGPHMHLPIALYDLDKAHIALCLRDLDNVYADIASFSETMALLIRMINDEFLVRIEKGAA